MVLLYLKKFTQLLMPTTLLALLVIGTLCTASIFVIISATFMNEAQKSLWLYQYRYEAIGVLFFLILALIPYPLVLKFSPYLYLLSLLLLISCFIPGIGHKVLGAYSWIRVAGFGFEPGEFAKISFLLALAYALHWRDSSINSPSTLLLLAGMILLPCALLAAQPAWGSALVFFGISLGMIFASGLRVSYILLALILISTCIGSLYYVIIVKGWDGKIPGFKTLHVVDRIKSFADPTEDKQGSSWQVTQSVIAISSGGPYGKGWEQGTQNVLGFLPRNTTYNDLIFSVIGEEQGFRGGAVLILLQGLLLLWCLWVAAHARDKMGTLVAVGVMSMLFTHVFVNIGMTMQLVPIIGIPLPFISYGGSFMIGCLAAMGLVASVWIHRKTYERA